jgi:hypothetical protein
MDDRSPSGEGRLSLSLALARAEGWLAAKSAALDRARNGAEQARLGDRALPARPGFMTWRYLLLSSASIALLAYAFERMK